jgi:hypothetical protein
LLFKLLDSLGQSLDFFQDIGWNRLRRIPRLLSMEWNDEYARNQQRSRQHQCHTLGLLLAHKFAACFQPHRKKFSAFYCFVLTLALALSLSVRNSGFLPHREQESQQEGFT